MALEKQLKLGRRTQIYNGLYFEERKKEKDRRYKVELEEEENSQEFEKRIV